MAIRSQFSERVFEFAYNAEFAMHHKAALIGCPDIPTQQQEKHDPWDVRFKWLTKSASVSSLFLQHKVVRRVDGKSGANAHRIKKCGSPYFLFNLDNDQYNAIRDLRLKGEAIYYCAPAFVERSELETRYQKDEICDGSLWLDVKYAGPIEDSKHHSIVYASNKSTAVRYSDDPVDVTVLSARDLPVERRRFEGGLSREALHVLYEELFDIVQTRGLRRVPRLTSQAQQSDGVLTADAVLQAGAGDDSVSSDVDAIARLASDYLDLSWILMPDDPAVTTGQSAGGCTP